MTPQPTVDPLTLLRRSVSRVLALESAAFTLEHQKGTTTLFPGLEMRKVSGVVDIPDKFRLTVEAESTSPRSFVEIQIAVVGDRAYMTNFITQQWRQVPLEALPFSFANLGQTLADIIEAVENPTLVGTERFNSYTAYRIRGQVQSDALATLVPGAGKGFDVVVELWLDRAEGLLLQALITGKVLPRDLTDSVRQLTLDDIDVPVNITLPPESNTQQQSITSPQAS
jgi:hypothetical protein